MDDVELKVSRSNTEHLLLPSLNESIKLKEYNSIEYAILPKCTSFKYLGIIIHQKGECGKVGELRISKL